MIGDGSKERAMETSGAVGGDFLWRMGCVDGVWGWCIFGWPSFSGLGSCLGSCTHLESCTGDIFMKELVLSCVYTRFDLWGFVAMISSRGGRVVKFSLK